MPKQSRRKLSESAPLASRPFHERFKIQLGVDGTKRKFVNRIKNYIWANFFEHDVDEDVMRSSVLWQIANSFGEEYDWDAAIEDYIKGDFYRCLHALEAAYQGLDTETHKKELSELIETVLGMSEMDLGIDWKNGVFTHTGAPELDEALVNAPLEWLSGDRYSNVRKAFQKGLSGFLESDTKPLRRYDVVRDMYEALEALAKIITGRSNCDLSANAELFIKAVNASEHYKRLLKEYIVYANTFRHGLDSQTRRPEVSMHEVESFVYLTGLFIRMAMK